LFDIKKSSIFALSGLAADGFSLLPDPLDYCFNVILAVAAAATGLAIVGNLFQPT